MFGFYCPLHIRADESEKRLRSHSYIIGCSSARQACASARTRTEVSDRNRRRNDAELGVIRKKRTLWPATRCAQTAEGLEQKEWMSEREKERETEWEGKKSRVKRGRPTAINQNPVTYCCVLHHYTVHTQYTICAIHTHTASCYVCVCLQYTDTLVCVCVCMRVPKPIDLISEMSLSIDIYVYISMTIYYYNNFSCSNGLSKTCHRRNATRQKITIIILLWYVPL